MAVREWFRRVVLGAAVVADQVRRFDAPLKPIDQMFADLRRGSAVRVGRSEALSVPAVLRGRNLLCSIATLPLVQRGPDRSEVRNSLLEQIDPNVPNVVTMASTIEDLVFEGIAWWRVTGFGFDMFPMTARRLDPASVSLDPPTGGHARPLPAGYEPAGPGAYVDGVWTPANELIRFDSPNPAVLQVGGRAIRRAILLDQAARLYAADPRPLGWFTAAENAEELSDDEIAEYLADWEAARRERSTGYIPPSMVYNSATAPTAADMQLVALQERASLEIANAFGLDPEELGVSTTSRTYANVQDRRQDKINDVLAPYMRAITDRLSMPDVTKRGYRVEFKLTAYLKSNPTERWAVYKTAKELGVMDPDEIRSEEDLPGPAPSAAPSAADAAPVDGAPAGAASALVHGFTGVTTGFVVAETTGFAADPATRTISGVAMPYGKIGEKMGLRFRFDRGALQWSEPGRVKLLRDHDYSQALGRAVDLKDAPGGLAVRFAVARGDDGDRALQLAEDGVLDGLSVGVEFDMAADTVPDPRNKGVMLVRRATLREVSLTAMPAFDDARVTKVAASRNGGSMDKCGTCGADLLPGVAHACQPAEPAPAGLTLNTAQLGQIATVPGMAEHLMAALFGTQAPAPVTPPEQPAMVDPAAGPALVREPAPYRFDSRGNLIKGSHDFSADLLAMSLGDRAAGDRATSWVRAQFDVASTDVNELNPTRNRPEMYVDQRTYTYPVWDAIDKGTLTDITPFTFPKFSSASGLVGAHTEGNEPSSGTIVTTSQTVTPTAMSGKAKITRETWDQGGNPQVSNLIWQQMTKGWYEALEAAAVAVLDAASPTQIDFSATPGLADDDLDQALTAAFAALQFIRGGFTMDTGFAQVDFYKALIAATDGEGRRLYPAIGPANAMGTVARRFGAVDVNGVTFLPAWALAATGTVAASSYLFDRAVVHGWASAPQRLTFDIEVANVYIGLWGYKATAISDVSGVREIVYDPS